MMPPLLGFLAAVLAAGPVYQGSERNLRVAAPRIDAAIQLDGQLSEAVWQQAACLTGFSEYAPDDGHLADEQTEVLIWYSPSAIYFGIRAQARPGSVRATLANRDRIDNDDSVQIYLATFNDGRQASVFGVNPLGVQMDGAVIESGKQEGHGFSGLSGGRTPPDLSPDFVFDSKGHLTDFGYEVEVRIPFKSLRYQAAPTQNWGIHVVRLIQSTGHEDSWVPARRSAASFLDQAGTLVGLTDLHRGLVMDLNPIVTGRVDGRGTQSGWTYDGRRPEVGGNVRWGLTPNLTLNATVNPDFSQVESDATQFQIDPRQALFFAEKRPFFLDGIEFFSTPDNLIYSRRIVEPVAATKLTGKIAGTTVAALSAVDDLSESADGASHPVFNVVRVQRDIGGTSRAALVYTSRLDGLSSNHVAGADAHLVWRKLYAVDLQAAVSRTARGRDILTAPLWQAAIARSGRRFSFRYSLNANDPDFRADTGFISRSGVVDGSFTNQIAGFGRPGALLEKWTGDVQVQGTWKYDAFVTGQGALERRLHMNSNFFLHGGWHTGFSVLVERYGYDPVLYANYGLLIDGAPRPFTGVRQLPNLDYVVSLDTPPVRGLSANVFVIWGKDENFFEWASANIVYSTLSLQWRPTARLRVDFDHNLQSFARRTDGSYVGIRRVPRLKLEYQANRAIFFRYVGEYATNYQDALRDDSRTNAPLVVMSPDGSFLRAAGLRQRSFRSDWLFSYQPRPGTVLFAGYGNTLATADATAQPGIRRTQDGLFLKLSYLFRM